MGRIGMESSSCSKFQISEFQLGTSKQISRGRRLLPLCHAAHVGVPCSFDFSSVPTRHAKREVLPIQGEFGNIKYDCVNRSRTIHFGNRCTSDCRLERAFICDLGETTVCKLDRIVHSPPRQPPWIKSCGIGDCLITDPELMSSKIGQS